MKVGAIALTTFVGLLRNRLITLFLALFGCVLLVTLVPLTQIPANAPMRLQLTGAAVSIVSGFGSLLSAWLGASVVAEEIRSGSILAILARPVSRSGFLLGKYLGMLLLMGLYVLFMLAFDLLLLHLSGQTSRPPVWVLIAYPLVRYAVYGALAMFVASRVHPLTGFAIVMILAVLTSLVQPGVHLPAFLPHVGRQIAYVLLPSTDLLSESRFIAITQTSLQKVTWDVHLIALSYGLDYALVCFLLAAWLFRRRSVVFG